LVEPPLCDGFVSFTWVLLERQWNRHCNVEFTLALFWN
jgi:hypothetical protein